MTFSYSPGAATDKDDIRAAIGDVDSSKAAGLRLEDEEIARALVRVGGGVSPATLDCVRQLKARMSSLVSERTVGSLTLKWAQSRYQALAALEKDLMRAAATGVGPYAGGISQSDKDSVELDTDRAQPALVRGMFDNPEAGPTVSESALSVLP